MVDIKILTPYNPLDKVHLGENIAERLLSQEALPLPPTACIGAGVYAIYYKGNFSLYKRLAEANKNSYKYPIYVGKAVPSGARKGNIGDDPNNQGQALTNRLADHTKSIIAAKNLELKDFCCKFLAVDDIWIPLAETVVIQKFQPVWNMIMDGFGNHDPGSGRTGQKRSAWDMIHPGRTWAIKREPLDVSYISDMQNRVCEHLKATVSAHD